MCVENYDIIFLNINKIGKDKFIVPPYFGGEGRDDWKIVQDIC